VDSRDTETLAPFHTQNECGTTVSSSIDTPCHKFYKRTHQGLLMVETDACLYLLSEVQEMPDSMMMWQCFHDVAVPISVQDEF